MQLDPRFRAALYAVVTVLFATGAGWFVEDRLPTRFSAAPWQEMSASLLMLHGGAAMLFLLLLGALFALHVRGAWRSQRNRPTGVIMLACNALLIVTAFGLYYFGSESLRRWTSDLHIAVGLGFPLLLAVHVVLGRRSLRAVRRNAFRNTPGRSRDDSPTGEQRSAALR